MTVLERKVGRPLVCAGCFYVATRKTLNLGLKPGKKGKVCLVEGQTFGGREELGLREYQKSGLMFCFVGLYSKVKVSF